MKRSAMALCAAAALLASLAANAQVTSTATLYSAVDAVTLQYYKLTITGVIQGEAKASTQTFVIGTSSGRDAVEAATLQTCVRLATIAMEKPGAYLFQVTPHTTIVEAGCTLSRVTP